MVKVGSSKRVVNARKLPLWWLKKVNADDLLKPAMCKPRSRGNSSTFLLSSTLTSAVISCSIDLTAVPTAYDSRLYRDADMHIVVYFHRSIPRSSFCSFTKREAQMPCGSCNRREGGLAADLYSCIWHPCRCTVFPLFLDFDSIGCQCRDLYSIVSRKRDI